MSLDKRFQIGLGVPSRDFGELRRWAEAADEEGLAFVAVGDNPALMRDTYVTATVLAHSLQRAHVGIATTSPRYRDPLVVATALSSLATLAPDRTFVCLATGRARRKASLAELRAHIVALRELWDRGETTLEDGRTLRLLWDAPRLPIYVSASGPMAQALAGELADGVFVESGVDEAAIAFARANIAEGARRAGRDPESIETWWYVRASLEEDGDEARKVALGPAAASGAKALARDPKGRVVPERFWAQIHELHERYDKTNHLNTGDGDPNRKLLADPDLRDYLFDRFIIAGSPKDWLARIDQLRDRGIDRLFIAAVVPDPEALVRLAGAEVIPALG